MKRGRRGKTSATPKTSKKKQLSESESEKDEIEFSFEEEENSKEEEEPDYEEKSKSKKSSSSQEKSSSSKKSSQSKSKGQVKSWTSSQEIEPEDYEIDEEEEENDDFDEEERSKPSKKQKTPSGSISKGSQPKQGKTSSQKKTSTPKETITELSEEEKPQSQSKKRKLPSSQFQQPASVAPELEIPSQESNNRKNSQQPPDVISNIPPALRTSQQQPASNDPVPRLMITHLELENFKSYAGKKTIGPFHKSFSSVVGPNGSGKSNIIDALLFVFGKRANKLRHKKLSELIHSSKNHGDLQYAKVSVYFQDIIDEGQDYKVVEGSKFVVSRIVKRDSSSQYILNDSKVNFNDVQSLLQSKGIDLNNNRFLILQGEVQQIATMKSKGQGQEEGLLEYLEDIIGTNQYVPKIEETEQLLEKANEERNEKVNRVKLIEKERENLEPAKIEAEEYLQKNKSILDKKSIMYQVERYKVESSVSNEVKQKKVLEAQLKEQHEKTRESNSKLIELEAQYKQKKKEHAADEEKLESVKLEFASFERKDIEYRENIKFNKLEKEKLTKLIDSETRKVEEKSKELEKLKVEKEEKENELVKLKSAKEVEESKVTEILSSLKDETAEFQESLEKIQLELMPLTKKLQEHQSQVDIKKSQLELVQKRVTEAEKQLALVEQSIQEIEETFPKKEKELASKQEQLKQGKKERENLTQALQKLKAQETVLAQETRQQRQKLEEAKNSLQDVQSQNKVLKELMKAQKEQKLEGIYGRLGDLGSIDETYDIAISTACPALNHIVVDTVENGEACVDFLRKHEVGVATFIILEKQKHLEQIIAKPFSCPSGAKRLFDLVKFDSEEYQTAFYYALQNTLVANDIDKATHIAYGNADSKRYRVVTLAGELIDISGTMSGGGQSVVKGGMRKQSQSELSPKEIQTLEKKLEKNEAQLSQLRQDIEEKEKTLLYLETGLPELEKVELPKIQLDLESMKSRLEPLKKRLPELKSQTKKSATEQNQIDVLSSVIQEMEKGMASTKKKVESLESQASQIQNKINKVGGERLKSQKAKVELLEEKINEFEIRLSKLPVTLKTTEKQIKKSKETIEESQQQLEKVKEKLIKIEKEWKSGEDKASEVLETKAEAEKILVQKATELKSIQKKFDQLKKVVDSLRQEEVEVQNQIDELQRKIDDSQTKSQIYVDKIRKLEKEKARTKLDGDEDEPLVILSEEELAKHANGEEGYSLNELKQDIASLEQEIESMKPNMNAIYDYRKKTVEYEQRMKELEEATLKRDEIKKEFEMWRKKRLDEFMIGFTQISLKLKELYQMITMGGDATLELEDSSNPFAGILFSVRPPKKSWKQISYLSGGEKTLSSLSLVFALHHYKPTPLYVMDEIDAALDFRNVSIVANYIKERTKNAQFIIISLRNYMFELADYLVGVYKTQDCSNSVTINPSTLYIPTVDQTKDPQEVN